MADAADGGGSGSDWEVVSLTASTYAAAPGPISPLEKTESPLLPNPPPPAHFFMSQHFNLPPGQPLSGTHLENTGCQESEPGLAVADGEAADADHLNMPSPENYCQSESERKDVLVLASPAAGNGLQVDGGGEELQQTTMLCSLPDATAGSDAAAADGSATLPAPAPAATVPAAAPSGGVGACNAGQAQAWWEKTFSFPRNNGTQPLAFRFVFVAGKLQLQEDPSPELSVHSQTQKVSCAVTEPLDQAKVNMLGGGSPVAQQG